MKERNEGRRDEGRDGGKKRRGEEGGREINKTCLGTKFSDLLFLKMVSIPEMLS